MSAVGRLGAADLLKDIDTLLCTMDEPGIVGVHVANRNGTAIQVRIAITTGGLPTNADYVLFDARVEANMPAQYTGMSLSKDEKVYVRANMANVSARVHGLPST